ncbi:MAG: hypothetical protein CSYNP_00206 [Syntrophus sp. SKADARSKE-3]|nr:hypothetical protein [Syntrophus sp. SKADARSKE-3]
MNLKSESAGETPEKALRELEQGKRFPCYLIYGDDEFLVKNVLNKILDKIIPVADRDLNLFTIDGEDVDSDSLCETLLTSPLFPGCKVVVVRRAPFFYSRQTVGDILQKVRDQLDRDALKAGRDFMTFLAVAGWTLEDLRDDGWKKITDDDWYRLVEGEAGQQREQWLPKVIAVCVQHSLKTRKATDEADQLMKTLAGGLPDGHFLIMTATVIDKRKRLFKTIQEIGRIITFPQIKGDVRQKAQLMEAAKNLLATAGKSLTDDAWTLLGKKTGFDLQHSMGALEKLMTHAGDRAVITEKDVADLVGKTKEDSIFNLTAALAEKKAAPCLGILNELLFHGAQPLMILAMLARELRFLLQAKILLLHFPPLGGFDSRMDYNSFSGRIYPKIKTLIPSAANQTQGVELAGLHPYVIFNTIKNSGRFSYDALVLCLEQLAEVDVAMKTSAKNPRLLLERFILSVCA